MRKKTEAFETGGTSANVKHINKLSVYTCIIRS
jgi:hypothetical protein